MPNLKTEDIKVRLPVAMKAALRKVAEARYTTESEIAREALLEYLRARDIELRETGDAAGLEATRRVRSTANISYLASKSPKKHPSPKH